MTRAKIGDFLGGWFIGNFEPSLYKTNICEVAVKHYGKGCAEQRHFHKLATEYTVIVSGRVRMFGEVFEAGDIVIAEPGDITGFEALEDTTNVVVKLPGANNDKYCVEE